MCTGQTDRKIIKIQWNMGAEIKSVVRYWTVTVNGVALRCITAKKCPEGCNRGQATYWLIVMMLSGYTLTCNIKFSDRNVDPGQ